MMSIYIKGMEMPPSCRYCEFRHMSMTQNAFCTAAHETIDYMAERTKRLDDCPLIPVPEHGDLIDTRPFDVLGFHNPEPGYNDTFMDGVLWMEDKIDNAPMVIPADPEEEEEG